MHTTHGGKLEEFAKAYGHDLSQVLDFSTNTNLHFDLQPLRDLLRQSLEAAFRYPDPTYARLREVLALRHGVLPKNILPTNGSTELIYLIARRFRAQKALIFAPSFSEYEAACRVESLEISFEQALEKDDFVFWRPDHIDTIGLAKPAVAFVGNPNNPSGRLAAKDWLDRLALACERHGTLLVADEAFMDFVRDGEKRSLALRSMRSANILVMRSLTKVFSIPGLRIGYAIGHPRTIESLARFQPTWSLNGLAQEVAIQLVADPGKWQLALDELGQIRQRFYEALKQVPGIKIYPSDVNFLLCRLDTNIFEIQKLQEHLGRRRILVRLCSDFRGLETGCFMRLALRREEENAILIEALKESLCYAS